MKPRGRPTSCTPKLRKELKAYIEDYEEHGHAMPSIAGFAVVSGIGRSTLHLWATQDDKPEFNALLDNLLAKQEMLLMNNGLIGTFNATIVKLALGKHGYSEKADITSGDKPIQNTWTLLPVATLKDG